MVSAIFIYGGIQALRAPQGHAQVAKPVLDTVAPAVDKAVEAAPIDQRPPDETLVKIDAGVKVVAGSMLALGRFPRLAATALAASLVPTTLAGHRFWEETDEAAKQEQTVHFLKNLGLLGGLLLAAAATEGRPSIGYRTSHAVGRSQHTIEHAVRRSQRSVKRAVRTAKREARIATRSAAAARKLPG